VSSTVLPDARTPLPPSAARRRRLVLAGGLAIGFLGLLYTADVALARDALPRGLTIAGADVGGRSEVEAQRRIDAALGARSTAPITLTLGGETLTIAPAAAGLTPDLEATVTRARRSELAPWDRVRSLFSESEAEVVVAVDEPRLRAAVLRLAKQVDRSAREGAVRFDGTTPVAVQPQSGRRLDVVETARRLVDGYLTDAPVALPVEETPVKTTPADVARVLTAVARPAVSGPVRATGDGKTLQVRPADVAAALSLEAGADGVISPVVDPVALEKSLGERLAAVEVRPRDARFSLSGATITITPSANGRTVDVEALARDLVPVLSRTGDREVQLTIRDEEPELTTERARTLGIKEPIGTFTTYHPCCRPRVQNIHRIADIVNGAVVLPGDTFSLNGYVGPRDRKRGFVDAPMILNGEFVDSVGGGVSQFATTMFNAVFFSGLEDVEHKAHSYYISRYPAGREATVSHPAPDLKWRNNSPYGVLVQTSYTSKSITVTFWGTKVYDSIESVSGPRTRVRSSYTKYKSGRDCESHQGGPGFDIVVTRIFKKGGREVKREKFFTRYLVDPTIVCRR
jgi:vancomycin resistance protein YoaR